MALGHAAAFSDDCDLPSSLDTNRLVGLQVSPLFPVPTFTLPFSPFLLSQRKIQVSYTWRASPSGLLGEVTPQLHLWATLGKLLNPGESHFPHLTPVVYQIYQSISLLWFIWAVMKSHDVSMSRVDYMRQKWRMGSGSIFRVLTINFFFPLSARKILILFKLFTLVEVREVEPEEWV